MRPRRCNLPDFVACRFARIFPAFFALILIAGCTTLRTDYPRTESWATTSTDESTLRAQVTDAAAQRGGESGFRLLENGADAFAARALTSMRAEQTIDVQTYLVHDGLTTRVLMHLVMAAAERGVRVRILLDDMSSRGNDFAVATLAAHPNIDVRLFNPARSGRENVIGRALAMITDFNRLHRRMHNKLWIVDNAVAISGGRNLGDEYFGAASDVNFADIDLLSVGPVVNDLSRSFDAYWNSPNAIPVEAFVRKAPSEHDLQRLRLRIQASVAGDAVQKSPYLARLREQQDAGFLSLGDDALAWGQATAVWDDPRKINARGVPPENQTLAVALQPQFAAARQDVQLVSAYFVPGDAGVAQLRALVERGVRVQVLTNSLKSTDVPFVYGAYAGYREPLLQAGVELYEMKSRLREKTSINRFGLWGSSRASLHTKAMVFDDETTFVGSYNLDQRSLFWNTEVGVIVHSPALTRALRDVLKDAFDPANSHRPVFVNGKMRYRAENDEGEEVIYRPTASPWRRLQSWLSDRFGSDRMM